MKKRLESLDVLRGADLFFLMAVGPILRKFIAVADVPWLNDCKWLFDHVEWQGFSPWDIIMPLFVFMTGITIPFALGRMREERTYGTALWRIVRRVVVLWVFGLICQGGLLDKDPATVYLYTNTLQAIAVAYAGSALLFLFTNLRSQICTAVVLLIGYWAAMEFISVDGFGGGDYTPEKNLAEWVDNVVLGRFRDGAKVVDGVVVFKSDYHYTWILSSLTFVVTGLLGMFAGVIVKSNMAEKRKLWWLAGAGVAMVAAGLILGIWHPIIKKIWTSSMTLFTGGLCFLLLWLCYYLIDCKGYRKGLTLFKVYGMNSIAAYMMPKFLKVRAILAGLLWWLAYCIGDEWTAMVVTVANVAVQYYLLYYMYKREIYLKV
jgi:predicted acyltransferase